MTAAVPYSIRGVWYMPITGQPNWEGETWTPASPREINAHHMRLMRGREDGPYGLGYAVEVRLYSGQLVRIRKRRDR